MNVADGADIKAAVGVLTKSCPILRAAYAAVGVPVWRTRRGDYAGLARIIAYQQVSTKAAATIWARVEAALQPLTPAAALAADIDVLRACGLSRPKIAHLKSIAAAIDAGALNLRRVARASDDDARAELTAVKGVGPWTADVYLMFCLGRTDVFPHADIGLSEAYRLLAKLKVRPDPRSFLAIGERWRPYRGVAAHLLWAYINQSRERETGGA